MTTPQILQDEYSSALVGHISQADEAAFHRAYELGRRLLGEGYGVLDYVSLHCAALRRVVADCPQADLQETLDRAAEFLAESLSAFEMSLRGYREANSRLAALNQTLQDLYGLAAGLNRCRNTTDVASFSIDRIKQIPGVHTAWITLHTADGIKIIPPQDGSPAQADANSANSDSDCTCIPLICDTTAMGVLQLHGTFSESERQVLVNIGNQISNALGRADVYELLERRIEERTRELIKAAKVKDDFLAMVSHELRTPLTSINAAVALFAAEVFGPASAAMQRPIRLAQSNCRRLMKLVDDLLDLTKLGREALDLDLQPLKLCAVINEVFENKRIAHPSHHFRLHVASCAREACVVADSHRLQQVVDNLLANAVKFSGANSEIELSIDRLDHDVRVSISDHGVGIPTELHDRVFNPFAQIDASTTRQTGGVGLGLNIAKSIIEAHRGILDFSSVEGKGTTFYFELPLDPGLAELSPPSGAA